VQSGIVGTLAAVLAAVLPARKAARVQPVDIVRSAA
jgi:ABC-type antimicrobial peptide transport system permease subunit